MKTLIMQPHFQKVVKFFLVIIFICFIVPVNLFSQGTVVNDSLLSSSLGYYKKVNVYLPQGYDPNGSIRYRVVYFLHEANENHTGYTFLYSILDSLIANNIIDPMLVVKPDGSQGPYLGSFYTNSTLYGLYEDFIYNDVVGHIDANYKTQANRMSRCIMGHSMGGYGSMKMAFKHTNLFRGAASHSGPLDLYHFSDAFPYLFFESGGSPPYHFAPFNGIFSALLFTGAGAFTPNLLNPPFYVDFPVDSMGNVIPSVFVRTIPHNPAHLCANINAGSHLALYFDCGIQDPLTLYGWNNGFRDSLVARNIPFRYEPYTGDHATQLPERFPISLQFLDSVMNDIPLPVELASFTSSVNNRDVNLNWMTSSEVNNSGFEIERRDARREMQDVWVNVGFVSGNGTNTNPNNYSFIDRGLNSGKYNYRLKQVDFNGNFEYYNLSNEVEIGVPNKFELSQNYPNPFNPETKINYAVIFPLNKGGQGIVLLKVYDVQGKEVATLVNEKQGAGYYSITFNGADFSSGVYFFRLQADNFVEVKKMTLLK